MARHPLHVPVQALAEPGAQMRGVFCEFDSGHADSLETEFGRPCADVRHQRRGIGFRRDIE